MPEYTCTACDFSTKIKTQFARHEKTKKHQRNLQSVNKEPEKYICLVCNTEFSTKSNLNRHRNKNCSGTKVSETDIYKTMLLEQQKVFNEERKLIYNHIDNLLKRVGNTTINQTNNIQINSYGNEDLSHITDTLKNDLIKIPYEMIPKMIEAVHFNDSKPENKNIALTNKKDNKIMVFKNNKWVYCNKDETINDLVDGKYFILDNHYQKLENDVSFSDDTKITYEKFKTFYDEGDKKVVDQLKKDCELILLNNR